METILEKIHKSGLKFLVPLSAEETYKLIVDEAMKLLKADYGHILLFYQGELQRVYASSPVFFKIKNRKRGFMYSVFKKRQAIILQVEQVASVHPRLKEINIKSMIGIPLFYRNQSIGVLGLLSTKENFFSEKDINTLKLFSPLASLAIRKTQLYDETKRALEARDLFISMAAHELRTPITTIHGYSQLLYSKFAGANTPESRWIEDLSWESLRLTYLVNELLEVNRIKTGQFEYRWRECSLKEVIKRSISDFRFTHPKHKIIFQDKADGKDAVIGDFNKLLQLVINLLDNAAKFSSSETEILVELESRGRYCHLSIKDQGKGIVKKDIHKIFEKFYQGTGHSKEGLGVGLFLVKNIVTQHHGTINIFSKENRGTRIKIKLPMVKHD